MNRITGRSYSDTTHAVTYSYDQTTYNGLTIQNGQGRRTGMSDGSGMTAWSYNEVGNVLTIQKTINGHTNAISYTYNLDGSVATIAYLGSSPRTVTYQPGNAQRPLWAKDLTNNIIYTQSATYAPPGELASVVNGVVSGTFNGITETRSYNNRLMITAIQAASSTATALNLAYSYPTGNNGDISTQTNIVNSNRTQTYTYDNLNRLLTAQAAATSGGDCWGQSFGNGTSTADDPLANLISINQTKCSPPQLSVSVSSGSNPTKNQFTSPTGFGYDLAGDMTADGAYTYTYDAEFRLISASGMTGGPYCYTYDGDGMRVMKSHANGGSCPSTAVVDMLYWRSMTGDTIAETDGSGSTTNSSYMEYVFFAGRRIAQSNPFSGNVYYYYADHLGSTRSVVNVNPTNSPADGSICFEVDYLPYGTENTPANFSSSCSSPPPFRYRFTGYERDFETATATNQGNDYAFARFYNSRLGRFMSDDQLDGSVTDPQTLNHYTYVRDNPVNLLDPRGLEGCEPIVCSPPPSGGTIIPYCPPLLGPCGGGGVRVPPKVPPGPPKQPPKRKAFLSRLALHLFNLLRGYSWNYGMQLQEVVTSRIVTDEPNPVVKGVADGLGVVGVLSESAVRPTGTLSLLITLSNNPSPADVVLGVVGLVPGPDVPLAFGTGAYDGAYFITNQIEAPILNAAPAQNINIDIGNGNLLTIPVDDGRDF
jgi:RHS repeat-associated protein